MHILYCDCGYTDIITAPVKAAVREFLGGLPADVPVMGVNDLCELAAYKDERLMQLEQAERTVIIACHERAVRWILFRAGVQQLRQVRFVNMRESNPQDIARQLQECTGSSPEGNRSLVLSDETKGEWVPWFPVIDYDRCTGCQQCLNFCLFGTYTANDENQVMVTNPSHCKTNCPACARVCPQGAIIFPKYTEAPINGGDGEDDASQPLDIKNLMQSDIYEVLRKRRAAGKQRRVWEDKT